LGRGYVSNAQNRPNDKIFVRNFGFQWYSNNHVLNDRVSCTFSGFELPEYGNPSLDNRRISLINFIPDIEDSLLMAEDDIEEALHLLTESEMTRKVKIPKSNSESYADESKNKLLGTIEELDKNLETYKNNEEDLKKEIKNLEIEFGDHDVEYQSRISELTKKVENGKEWIKLIDFFL
jgi:hypothetical protein